MNNIVKNAKKIFTPHGSDGTTYVDSGSWIHSATGKTTPVDADEIPLADSASSFSLKKVTWANIKATLKTYFDTLYPSGSGTSTGTNTGDNAVNTTSNTYADGKVADAINDGTTTVAPSQNAVFDALALKLTASNNLSDVSNKLTSRNNLGMYDIFLTGGNQTMSSNVATNITELVFTPTINKRYKVDGVIHLGCSSTGGVKLQVTLPAGATVFIETDGRLNSATAFSGSVIALSATLTAAFCTANSNLSVILNGEIQMSSTAGNIQFGFASGTDTQTSTIYQLGTCITFTQLN